MRRSRDLQVCTTTAELLHLIKCPYSVKKPNKRGKHKNNTKFYDITCTLDIETTNLDADGFLYTIQFCIDGVCCVLRYVEDFIECVEFIITKWHITENQRLVFYVHNLGYEFVYLSQILAREWGIKRALYTASRKPLYITFCNGIELRDSLKLFQKSLARATVGCPHEKLVGDLDYTVYRTPDTELTQKEFDYCVNDVIGLYEAIERLKAERGYNQATIPYTNTGMVIDEVNKSIAHDAECKKQFKKLQLSKEQMRIAYNAMAGGDTHGTRWRAGKTFYNCNSYDFKSAHPSQQLLWKFPVGSPIDLPENLQQEEIENIIDAGYGWIGELYILNPCIKDECPDPCISVSKCNYTENICAVDNGRLLTADAVTVYCDSNDYQRIIDAYTYDGILLCKSFCFQLAYLPRAFRMAIFDKFKIKETMKNSPDYMFSKICVNTIFGACAQKTIRDEYDVTPADDMIHSTVTNWQKNLESKDEKQVEKSQENKFPFLWGLWTASLSRLKLWQLLKLVGWDKVIYWDTDSCKYEGEKSAAVDEYNAEIKAQCERRECVVEKSTGNVYIGVAEDEHPQAQYGYKEFRFLHAKCYAARTCSGELESTIAGVGKKQGVSALHDDINNLNDLLVIPDAGGMMLAYHDAPIHLRSDFQRYTETASWIVMTPRRYEVKGLNSTLLNEFAVDTLA